MTALAGALAAGAITAAADAIPPWLALIIGLGGAGGFIRLYTGRAEKRLAERTADKLEQETAKLRRENDEARENLILRLQGKIGELELQIEKARTEAANQRYKRGVIQRGIELAHDEIAQLRAELATTRAQAGLEERRQPPETEDPDEA